MGSKARSETIHTDSKVAEIARRGEESRRISSDMRNILDQSVQSLLKKYPGKEKELMNQLDGQYQGLMRKVETKRRLDRTK